MNTANITSVTAEPGKQELFITREFEAPRELVFRAFSEPELLAKWMGPRDMEMRIDHYDARSGGSWRYVSIDPTGNEYGFHGTIHELKAPERCIQTFEFEGLPESGHVALETVRFEVLPGDRTRVVIQSVFQSVADRDGMVQSGMERGVREGHERLDDLLQKELTH